MRNRHMEKIEMTMGKWTSFAARRALGQGKGGGPQQNGAAVMNKDKGSGKAERLR